MTFDVDDLIATARPRTEKVRICARGDLVEAHAAAVAEVGRVADADSLAGDGVREALAAVRRIEEEQESSTITFTVTAVAREVWATLLAQHAPTREQRRAGNDHDPVNFPIHAVAACIVDPPTTLDQVKAMASSRPDGTPVLPAGEWNRLWNTVIELNVWGTPTPKLPAATDRALASELSSTTPPLVGSPEGGSLAGSGEQ